MASITLTIPDAIVQRVLTGFCSTHGYAAQIPSKDNAAILIDNPETKAEFIKRCLLNYIKTSVREYEEAVAKREAAAKSDVEIGL